MNWLRKGVKRDLTGGSQMVGTYFIKLLHTRYALNGGGVKYCKFPLLTYLFKVKQI